MNMHNHQSYIITQSYWCNIIWQCFTHPSSICISTQKPCFYLFSHSNPHRTPRVLTPTTASLDALVHAPLRHKRTCGRSPKASWKRTTRTTPPCDSGEFLNSCHIGKFWKIYMLWTMCEWYCNYIIDDCLGTQKTPKKASPEKKHGSQETGLDGTWSEELAPNALTWTQKIPQLNEPMHGTSLQITFKTTSKTYQVQESKVDSKVSRICASKCAKHPMHAWSHL